MVILENSPRRSLDVVADSKSEVTNWIHTRPTWLVVVSERLLELFLTVLAHYFNMLWHWM